MSTPKSRRCPSCGTVEVSRLFLMPRTNRPAARRGRELRCCPGCGYTAPLASFPTRHREASTVAPTKEQTDGR